MSVFRFMEYAVGSPANRNHYKLSKEVVGLPFKKNNRFKEYWRSMFLYQTNEPTEDDSMFGNFYLESDEEDFATKRNMMLDVAAYLRETYRIPSFYVDFFVTNRSIWLSVPAKVFGCYGSAGLHLIYRLMAEEIQSFLLNKGYKKGLDLSIYRWNGLIHSLGSYLPQSEAWVTKFGHNNLEDSLSMSDLRSAKFDNGFSFSDIQVITKANAWYKKLQKRVAQFRKQTKKPVQMESMIRLEERGTLDVNRNLHIYSYSLYLKQLGYSFEQAVQKVQSTFDNAYVFTRECIRTIRSAIEGSKFFNPTMASTYLDQELFEGLNESNTEAEYKNTFIIPRLFIENLQNLKANHHVYRLLFNILHTYQMERKTYTYSLTGEKYKKDIISRFEKLAEAGIISYAIRNDMVTCQVIFQKREVYQSHIVVPTSFVQHVLPSLGKELTLLVELWRGSYKVSEKVWYFSTHLKTIAKRLRAKLSTVERLFGILKKKKIVWKKFLFTSMNGKEYQAKIQEWVDTIRSKKTSLVVGKFAKWVMTPILSSSENLVKEIIKCNYSP